jgi:hypothetical protein
MMLYQKEWGPRMRRIFYVLGVAFAVIIVGGGGLVGFAAYRGSGLDKESKAYVDQAVIDIGKKWDPTELVNRSSPSLLKIVSPEQFATLFQQLAKFGKFIHYDGATGQATMKVMMGGGSGVSAHYDASATFENGPAHFRIDLSKRSDRWMIDGFYVDVTPPAAKPVGKTI